MDTAKTYESLKLKDLLSTFCGKPTPFPLIDILDEEQSVAEALDTFEKSGKKRKVIGIKNKSGQITHLGYNELLTILNNLGKSF